MTETSFEWDTEPCQQSVDGRRDSSWHSHRPLLPASDADVWRWSSASIVCSCSHRCTCTTSCHRELRRTSSSLADQAQLCTTHTDCTESCVEHLPASPTKRSYAQHTLTDSSCLHWRATETKWSYTQHTLTANVCTDALARVQTSDKGRPTAQWIKPF